ncbi:MAG: two-component system response regulator [Phycisphaerae bacterium]
MCNTILVVDDDPSIRMTVEMVLEETDYQVRFAENGQAAIQTLEQGYRGLVLLDIMMPCMDGWQTLKAMVDQGLYEGNIVCMLTAVLDPGPEMEGLKEYVLDYVRKPFTPDELIEAVDNAIALVE